MYKLQKKYVFALVATLISVVGMAAPRTLAEAEALANEFVAAAAAPGRGFDGLTNRGFDGQEAMRPVSLAFTESRLNAQTPAFYVFDRSDNNGFVIVSADDKTPAILGYTDSGSYLSATTNANFAFWMRRYCEQMSAIGEETEPMLLTQTTAIAPLLGRTAWDQDSPYNDSLPIDNLDQTRCYTGCVATAAAQVLYKWKYPVHGTGTKSYRWKNDNCNQREVLFADFENTYYDWDSMTETYGRSSSTASKAAVAQLMRHLGIATEMKYGGETAGGSGSWTDDMGAGLEEHFGYVYDKFITEYSNQAYSGAHDGETKAHTAEWNVTKTQLINYFNADLEAGRPIIMGGESNEGGHEFVCDGRDESGRFHINWGWSGSDNGYFALSALNCSGYNFSHNLDALIGLQPALIDTIHVESVALSAKEINLNVNGRMLISAEVLPDDATFRNLTWTSSDSAVAIVSNGVVRGLSTGSALIVASATEDGLSDTCLVTVSDTVIPYILVTDTLMATDLVATGSQYEEFSGVEKPSGAVYAGNSAFFFNSIQLRLLEGTEGIYTTTSPGLLESVQIGWSGMSQVGRTVSLYASEDAFADVHAARSTCPWACLSRLERDYSCPPGTPHFALLPDGEAVAISRIYVTWQIEVEPEPEGISRTAKSQDTKILIRNDQLQIVRNGITYKLTGQRYE